MADKKISQLDASAPLDGTELLEVSQDVSGTLTSRKATAQAIADLAAGGGGGTSTVVTTTGTTYTAAATDDGSFRRFTSASAKSATFEPEATTALPDNGEWYFYNEGVSDLTLIAGTGVTITPPAGGTLVVPSGGTVAVKRLAADLFVALGNTVAP